MILLIVFRATLEFWPFHLLHFILLQSGKRYRSTTFAIILFLSSIKRLHHLLCCRISIKLTTTTTMAGIYHPSYGQYFIMYDKKVPKHTQVLFVKFFSLQLTTISHTNKISLFDTGLHHQILGIRIAGAFRVSPDRCIRNKQHLFCLFIFFLGELK